MSSRVFVFLGAFCLAAATALAQGPPPNVGPPPPTVIDAVGAQVGPIVDHQIRPVHVRYTIPGGDVVFLEATPLFLRTAGSGILFFTSTDCSGTTGYAGEPLVAGNVGQLTLRQAVVVNTTPPGGGISSRLFVTAPLSPVVAVPGVIVASRFTSPSSCSPISPFPLGFAVIHTEVENLSSKFTPPFRIQ